MVTPRLHVMGNRRGRFPCYKNAKAETKKGEGEERVESKSKGGFEVKKTIEEKLQNGKAEKKQRKKKEKKHRNSRGNFK